MFTPTYSQYKRYKYNDYVSNSFCSNECRWKKEYLCKYHDDYVSVFVKRSNYNPVYVFEKGKKTLSRLIMSVTDKNKYIDHINGNPLDNRRSNLRVVSHQENMMNKKNL